MPRGVQTSRRMAESRRRELQMRDSDDQCYGTVTAVLGNGRFTVQLFEKDPESNQPRSLQCRVRGSMRRREWVNNGDVVLVARRDFDDAKGDIVTRYLAHEVSQLRRYGEIPEDRGGVEEDDDAYIIFDDEDADIAAI